MAYSDSTPMGVPVSKNRKEFEIQFDRLSNAITQLSIGIDNLTNGLMPVLKAPSDKGEAVSPESQMSLIPKMIRDSADRVFHLETRIGDLLDRLEI